MRKTTNLDDISIFVAAAEAGTFSAAGAHLQVPASTISRSVTRLEKGIDLLFVRRSQRGLSLIARGLFASRRYVQNAGMPAEPADLTSYRCIGSGRWTLSKGGKTVTPDIVPRVVTDDPLVHRQLVLDDGGIAILPLYIALNPVIAKTLVPILPGWQPKSVVPCALYSDGSRLTPKVKVFLDFIQKYIGTDLDPRLQGTKARDCFTNVGRRSPAGRE